jgi:hypothetical protein
MPTNIPPRFGVNDMNTKNVKVISIGSNDNPINFMDGLSLLFIGLKLTGHLDTWSWVEVLSPLWGPFMIVWFIRLVVSTFFKTDENEE